jgi:hypothetical protein
MIIKTITSSTPTYKPLHKDTTHVEVFTPYTTDLAKLHAALKQGNYMEWTPRRIKHGFRFGNGSVSDLQRYAKQNKANFTLMIVQ